MSITSIRHTPDNPREWNPNEPLLKSPYSPHEPALVLRMEQAGWPAPQITKALKIGGTQLVDQLYKARKELDQARLINRSVHLAVCDEGDV